MLEDDNSFFEQVFNTTPSLVALFSTTDKKIVRINRHGMEMFEVQDKNEFCSLVLSGKIFPKASADLSAYLKEWEDMAASDGITQKELQFQTATGRIFWGQLQIDGLLISHEKHLLIKITDIDTFKKSELAALRNAQQFEALFNNSTIGIVITNQQGQIINFNEYAERQFGFKKEEILGQPVEILIPRASHDRHRKYRDTFIQHPQNREMGAGRDLYARRKDNSEFPVEISLSPYRIEGENYVIAFTIDISVRKKNEALVLRQKEELETISAQVIQLNAELEKKVEDRTKMLRETLVELEISKEELSMALEKEKELGELKSRFVTMASHEFRTPLSTILSSSYIVQQYITAEDHEKRNKHLLKIQHAVQTLTFILEDFLSLGKLEEGLVQAQLQVVTADELLIEIEGILEEMEQMLKKEQVFQFTHAAVATIITDKKLLRNILVNLVSNAIKYSPENSTISIHLAAENKNVKISVSDQGIGIPETEQKYLFGRFFRATNASNIQGTGLGLHIVNSYLKLIKGDIEMKSELNKGTTFTIVLNTEVTQQ